jgi:hypothetical protein
MDWLDEELKRAFERKQPAPEFAARVAAAARRKPRTGIRRWIAIAASVAALAGGAGAYRQYQGLRAKRQVMLAVRIAADKLNHVQSHVLEISQ